MTFGSSWVSLKTSSQMPQTDSWSSPPTPRVGTEAPELEPPALVSCDICWWVKVQPLPLWWSCPSSSACWWETNGLLHPRNRWKCRPPSLMVRDAQHNKNYITGSMIYVDCRKLLKMSGVCNMSNVILRVRKRLWTKDATTPVYLI